MAEKVYLSTEETWGLLNVSKATFYRNYYDFLVHHPTTRKIRVKPADSESERFRYLYLRETVMSLLEQVDPKDIDTRRHQMQRLRNTRKKHGVTSKGMEALETIEFVQMKLPF